MVEGIARSGLAGMNRAASDINAAAERISSGNSDLAQDIPQVIISSHYYSASAKLISVEDEMNKSILDILA